MVHEDIAVHLERGDRLDAHDCPCWRVAYAKAQLDNYVLPASDVVDLQQTIAEREQRATETDREVAELRVQVERLEELHAEGAEWL